MSQAPGGMKPQWRTWRGCWWCCYDDVDDDADAENDDVADDMDGNDDGVDDDDSDDEKTEEKLQWRICEILQPKIHKKQAKEVGGGSAEEGMGTFGIAFGNVNEENI